MVVTVPLGNKGLRTGNASDLYLYWTGWTGHTETEQSSKGRRGEIEASNKNLPQLVPSQIKIQTVFTNLSQSKQCYQIKAKDFSS